MTAPTFIRLLLSALWLLIAARMAIYQHDLPQVPEAIHHILTANPLSIISLWLESAALLLLVPATIGTWSGHAFGRRCLFIALMALLLSHLSIGVYQMNSTIYAFDEMIVYTCGLLLVLAYQREHNIATLKNYYLLCLACVLGFAFLTYSVVQIDSMVEKVFIDFNQAHDQYYLKQFFASIATVVIDAWLIALAALFFRIGIARYLFVLVTLFSIFDSVPHLYFMSGLTEFADDVLLCIAGMLSALIFCQPVAARFWRFRRVPLSKNIILSFYSRRYYQSLAYERKGLGIGLLLVLALISCLIGTINVYQEKPINQFFSNQEILAQIPTIKIHDGTYTIDKPMPYTIYENHTPVIVIDKTGKFTSLSSLDSIKVLITADKLFINNNDQVNTVKLSLDKLDASIINKSNIRSVLLGAQFVELVKIYCFAVLFFVAFILFLALLIASIGQWFKAMARLKLNLSSRVRLINGALTPGIIVGIILNAAQWDLSYVPLLFFAVYVPFVLHVIHHHRAD